MAIYNFKKQFSGAIRAGTKTQTIRAHANVRRRKSVICLLLHRPAHTGCLSVGSLPDRACIPDIHLGR